MTTPPQFSADGQWWWDGERWVPAAQAPQPQAPQAPQAPWATPTPGASEQAPWATPQQATPQQGTPQQPAQPQGSPYPASPQAPQPAWGTPQPAYLPYGTPPPPKDSTDGKAIGALVASLIWACGVGSVVGVILGHVSRSQARRENREPSGLALAGLILGYLGLLGSVAVLVLVVAFKDPIVEAVQNELELQSASEAQQSLYDASGHYSSSLEELRPYGYDDLDGTVDVTVVRVSATSYCMSARSFGETFYVSDENPDTSTTPCS